MLEFQAKTKEERPKKVVKSRGVLKVDGLTEFNPDANLVVTRKSQAPPTNKKDKEGCSC